MRMILEFKEFATRGNVADMAVGIIIGTAFGKIVSSLVNDIIMPPIGLLLGNVDFSKPSVNSKGKRCRSRDGNYQLWNIHQHPPGFYNRCLCYLHHYKTN